MSHDVRINLRRSTARVKDCTCHTCDREGSPDILGAEPAATLDEIERTRRAFSGNPHPPHANRGDTVALHRFREVTGACHLPGDPGRRAEFDAPGWQHGHAGGSGPGRAPRGGDDGVSELSDGISGRSVDLFGDIESNRRVVDFDPLQDVGMFLRPTGGDAGLKPRNGGCRQRLAFRSEVLSPVDGSTGQGSSLPDRVRVHPAAATGRAAKPG